LKFPDQQNRSQKIQGLIGLAQGSGHAQGISIPNLLAIVFTVLIIAIMLLGTLWIMFDLLARMI